jgi:D-sedoheptulose 7-phosphate isomerase
MIAEKIQEAIAVKERLLNDKGFEKKIIDAIELITNAYRNGGKVLFCGNGGSAADAQHLAAELSGKFYLDREPLEAEACHVNTSFLTAVSNDYSFEMAFARYIRSAGKKGDVLVGLSTSGNSQNIIEAFKAGRESDMILIALTGHSGGKMKDLADCTLNIPSEDTPRIQEAHILIGHIICEMVEKNLFSHEP